MGDEDGEISAKQFNTDTGLRCLKMKGTNKVYLFMSFIDFYSYFKISEYLFERFY